MDLSEYAGADGESVLVRFEYITDEGVNLDGIVIDDIAVPELGFADDAETDGDWTGERLPAHRQCTAAGVRAAADRVWHAMAACR